MNCIPTEKKPEQNPAQTTSQTAFGMTNPMTGNKCNHGPGGRCFNCVVPSTGKDQTRQQCSHGPGTKCLHCYDE